MQSYLESFPFYLRVYSVPTCLWYDIFNVLKVTFNDKNELFNQQISLFFSTAYIGWMTGILVTFLVFRDWWARLPDQQLSHVRIHLLRLSSCRKLMHCTLFEQLALFTKGIYKR